MWKLKSISKSPKPAKKWRATFTDGDKEKHTDFGAAGMDDFTLTKDEAQRDRYRTRHQEVSFSI